MTNTKMKFLEKLKKWPIGKKRIFSVSLALFLTVFIIIVNFGINSVWVDDVKYEGIIKNNSIDSLQESLKQIINQARPVLDQTFGSSTASTSAQNGTTTYQINSTSSSFSTGTNIVE